MGVLDFVRGRNDSRLVAPPGTAQPPKSESGVIIPEYSAQDLSASDSDTLSLEAQNEKEIHAHPDEITENADLGVKKAEAAALVWSKKAVYATYAW
jgi:antitoxin component of MazEF toxin-antitoxin module